MALASLLRPAFWLDLGWEQACKLTPPPPATPTPTWELPAAWRARARVRWPARYNQYDGAEKLLDPVREGLRAWLPVSVVDLPQPYAHTATFELLVDGQCHLIALDFWDHPPLNDEAVAACPRYFKMQYREAGYGALPQVLPGGYHANHRSLYTYLPALRRAADHQPPRYAVYGRFGRSFATAVRTQALDRLSQQTRFPFEGGMKVIRYSRFLREVAQAQVCINLPGNGQYCFRLFDYLAVGACIIGPRPRNTLHQELVDRTHLVYCQDDFSDLVDLCDYYLHHDDERRRMVAASRAFFDRYLHCQQLAAYYLHHCVALSGG